MKTITDEELADFRAWLKDKRTDDGSWLTVKASWIAGTLARLEEAERAIAAWPVTIRTLEDD